MKTTGSAAITRGVIGLTIGIGVSSATPARADVAVVQKTVIDCPGVKQMLKEIPEERRGPLLGMMSPMLTGTPWITTTYVKGSRMREDMGQTTVVVNSESGKSFTLNRQTKAYSIGPYDPFQKAAGAMTCQVRPTHRTAMMLGHAVDVYDIAMTSSVLPKSQISGEIWAAPDLPTPPIPGYATGTAAAFQSEMAKIKGMPLAYTIVYHNTPAGDIKVVSYATAIAEKQLSEAVFRIPSDFHKGATRMATGTPSAGFPLGDGMPLDSMSAVTNEMATGDGDASGGMSGLLGSAGGSGDMSQMLAGMSPGELQKLLSMAQGAGGSAAGLNGMSAGQLQQMLGAITGGGGSGGDMSGMINPQMLQQLSGELQSLLNDDE